MAKKRINTNLIIGVLLAIFVVMVLYNTILQNQDLIQMAPTAGQVHQIASCNSFGGYCTKIRPTDYFRVYGARCDFGVCYKWDHPTITACSNSPSDSPTGVDGFCIPADYNCATYGGSLSDADTGGRWSKCSYGKCCVLGESSECTTDVDCTDPSLPVCEAGVCVECGPLVCDFACASGYTVVDGCEICECSGGTPDCVLDADCAIGESCVEGTCVPGTSGCIDNTDCTNAARPICNIMTGICEAEATGCEPWTLGTTGDCLLDDTQVITFTSATCAPETEIQDCDFGDRKVIGGENDPEVEEIDFELEIDGDDFAGADPYRGDLDVRILNDDEVIVEFEWDFDDDPLNLRELYLEKQDSNDDFGFLIVNGIDADKTFYIDVIDSYSNAVCIFDGEIDDIDDMTDDCFDSDETFLTCPGTEDDYECSIYDGRFEISGLENSAVKEFSYTTSDDDTCTPTWTCGSWSNLEKSCGTKTCTDSSCDSQDRIETKDCPTITQDECDLDSDCYTGEECKNGNCVSTRDEPNLPENNAWIWYLAIGVLGVLLLSIIGLIIHYFMNKPSSGAISSSKSAPPKQPPRMPSKNLPRRPY